MAKCLALAVGAAKESNKVAPQEPWKDKWQHGYVGCVLRQHDCPASITAAIATAKEVKDSIDGTASKQDVEATMYGWEKGLWGAKVKVTLLGIRLKHKSCKDVCDHFKDKWIALAEEEGKG